MKGRKPIPAGIKLLMGNPGKRPLDRGEPRPRAAWPRPPAQLSPMARREWRRISRELKGCGLLTLVDRAALAAYCQAWARWVEAEEQINSTSVVVKGKDGKPMENPYLAVANRAMEQMRRFLVEFGMTPSSRSRITGTTGHLEKDALEEFMEGKPSRRGTG